MGVFAAAVCIIGLSGVESRAAEKAKFEEVASDAFLKYHLLQLKAANGKETGEVLWAVENMTRMPLEVGRMTVRYSCDGGNSLDKTHYFGPVTLAPGEKKSYMGADKVCLFNSFKIRDVAVRGKNDLTIIGNSKCPDGRTTNFIIDETNEKYIKTDVPLKKYCYYPLQLINL